MAAAHDRKGALRLSPLERIAIIGCGGSGKSTVARQLAEALRVPVTHLDTIYYDAEWKPLPQEEFAAK